MIINTLEIWKLTNFVKKSRNVNRINQLFYPLMT